jgi:hypothetical protein
MSVFRLSADVISPLAVELRRSTSHFYPGAAAWARLGLACSSSSISLGSPIDVQVVRGVPHEDLDN